MDNETRNCQNCKDDFVVEKEDFNFYEKIKVPPPTFCPLCRAERRMVVRNERKLFKVKDAFTGQEIFSLYPTEGGRKSVTKEEWFSDDWDTMKFGRDVDFSRPFLVQILELKKEIPAQSLRTEFMVNSPYSANASSLKNSYLCFNSSYSEDCMYGNAVDNSKDCIDNSHVNRSERCYESFWLDNCYQCYFTTRSMESRNLWFCRGCVGCNDCFGSVNLRKASYCIFNKQYTREEYFKEIANMNLNTRDGLEEARKKARAFWYTQPSKFHQGLKNLNCTGSYVTNSKNVKDSFLIREGENLRYCQYLQVPTNKDCYDVTAWGDGMELQYETCLCGDNGYNLKFCDNCWPNCKNLEYCIDMFSSSDCFGCVGLNKKQYCILNKQYTKEEYEKLIPKLKELMNDIPYLDFRGLVYKYGEFFPIETNSFGYNNTTAAQYFSVSKEEALQKRYPWIEVPRGEYAATKKAGDLPQSINETGEEWLREVVECEKCSFPFRILENEFLFYKKDNLPLPTMCHECRFKRRITDRLKIELYKRECFCGGETDKTGVYANTAPHVHGNHPCGEIMETGYSLNSPEIVYCEKCYQAEVY